MRIDLDSARQVKGRFRIAPPAALDPDVYAKVREYKERIAARYIPIGEEDVERLPGSRFYISRKLDGEHNHLYYEKGRAAFIKPGGATLHGLPVLDEAAAALKKAGVKSCIIPGELIVERKDGRRTRIYDVIRLLDKPASEKDLARFNFAPFDILELDGASFDHYEAAYGRLKEIFAGSRIRPVETVISGSRETILNTYEQWVRAEGDEGLMIRSDLPFRYKFKAAHRFDAVVVGYREWQGRVAGLLLALMHPDDRLQILGTVSDGIEQVTDQLAERLVGLEINSEYIHVDQYHSSYRMVRPEVIVEVNSDDILTKHVDGRPYRKMVLDYIHEASEAGDSAPKNKRTRDDHKRYHTYKPVRNAPFVGLQRTSFIRFRDDKSVTPSDLRVSQVTDLVVIDAEKTPDFRRQNLSESEILVREVYARKDAKTAKAGGFAVRKIVAWKTNKETADPAYSAYVVHFTDFSPNRAEPLQREVALTDDAGQVEELVAGYRKKCVLRGWQPYADERASGAKIKPQASGSGRKTKVATKKKAASKQRAKKTGKSPVAVPAPQKSRIARKAKRKATGSPAKRKRAR